MKAILFTILRVIALVIIFTVLLSLTSSLTTPTELAQRMTQEQVSQATVMLPVVSLIMTLMLAYLALRSRWHGLKLEWTWKLAVGAILYVIVYFTFGYYVAWRTPSLPEFHGGTDPGTFLGQLANVMRDTPWLPVLQIFRGLIWTGIGCIIIRMHKGQVWEVIFATGVTFTVLMNASLLFPNPFMPPVVAHAHAIELVSSNLLYGILLSGLMLWNPTKQERSAKQAYYAN